MFAAVQDLAYHKELFPVGPHLLFLCHTHTLTEHHISMLLEHLQWYHAEHDAFLQQILTGDEA